MVRRAASSAATSTRPAAPKLRFHAALVCVYFGFVLPGPFCVVVAVREPALVAVATLTAIAEVPANFGLAVNGVD